jgi:hypothetical protein
VARQDIVQCGDASQTAALVANALGTAIANHDPQRGVIFTPITARNSPRGHPRIGPSGPGRSRQWARSASATTTLSSNHSRAECKPSYSTGIAPSWPTRTPTIESDPRSTCDCNRTALATVLKALQTLAFGSPGCSAGAAAFSDDGLISAQMASPTATTRPPARLAPPTRSLVRCCVRCRMCVGLRVR